MIDSFGVRAALLATAAILSATSAVAQTVPSDAAAQTSPEPGAPPQSGATGNDDMADIVVTGQTTRDRPLITASADITYADREAIDRRAPRSTADLLELVPGIFVEGTAGPVSNNYSVRGLQGGGQRFVQLEEDGMPILYSGGGADFFFDQDLTIDRLEAVKGGSSGVLTVNGAGATINFISRRPSFTETVGTARVTAYDYGLRRGDFYLSTPLAPNLAFDVGGYVQSNPGVRDNPFDYAGWRVKGGLTYRFDGGGSIRLSAKGGDVENAFYATQPYRFQNGKPAGITGLDTQFGNIGGDAFTNIAVPVSTFAHPSGFREFRGRDGIKARTAQVRLDFDKPLTENIEIFAKARYLKYSYDFNGIFPGSGTGNAGLTSAVNYLTPNPAQSPIIDLLRAGFAAYPTTTRFGIKNLRTGVIIGSNETDRLNALNGNGFLQRTTLNHDYIDGRDLGINAGARWEIDNGSFKNSLTIGGMYYNVKRAQDQSATASVVNDVRSNSDIYDIVALNGNNQEIGTLSDNGLVSYGDWGAGIRERLDSAISVYANDEIQFGDLRIDGGIRWESDDAEFRDGQAAAVNQAVPQGTAGVIRNVGSTFNGQFVTTQRTQDKIAWTVGANYLFTPNLSIYARYANGFQTNNTDPITTIELYEAGVRFQAGRIFSGSATVFRTNFVDQNYNFADPVNPSQQVNLNADLRTEGVEIDAVLRPIDMFSLNFQGVFQNPRLQNLQLNGQNQAGFEGNRPERTPATLFTVTPVLTLPNDAGEVFGRVKYVGKIFADNGNGVVLPDYTVIGFGATFNLTERLQLALNADNVFDAIGLTEGNPRQGQTQAITDGFFYARGIVGPTYGGSLTFRF